MQLRKCKWHLLQQKLHILCSRASSVFVGMQIIMMPRCRVGTGALTWNRNGSAETEELPDSCLFGELVSFLQWVLCNVYSPFGIFLNHCVLPPCSHEPHFKMHVKLRIPFSNHFVRMSPFKEFKVILRWAMELEDASNSSCTACQEVTFTFCRHVSATVQPATALVDPMTSTSPKVLHNRKKHQYPHLPGFPTWHIDHTLNLWPFKRWTVHQLWILWMYIFQPRHTTTWNSHFPRSFGRTNWDWCRLCLGLFGAVSTSFVISTTSTSFISSFCSRSMASIPRLLPQLGVFSISWGSFGGIAFFAICGLNSNNLRLSNKFFRMQEIKNIKQQNWSGLEASTVFELTDTHTISSSRSSHNPKTSWNTGSCAHFLHLRSGIQIFWCFCLDFFQ